MVSRAPRLALSTGAAALLVVFASGPKTPRPTSHPTTLRIESLSENERWAQVASSPWVPDSSHLPLGVWLDSATSPEPRRELLVRTPAAAHVADLVLALRVTAVGAGAVRLHLGPGDDAQAQHASLSGRA